MLLRSRPVYTTPAIQVFLDEGAYFGSVTGSFDPVNSKLDYGQHFALKIDQEDGSSRSGILLRINQLWPKPTHRIAGLLAPFIDEGFGTIKVIYTAGYSVDTLPAAFRFACNLLVARMRYLMPLGMELNSESYEERNIGLIVERKDYLLSLVKPLIIPYRNWKW